MITELESYNLLATGSGAGSYYLRGERKLLGLYFEVTLQFGSEHSKRRTALIQKEFPPYHVIMSNTTKKFPLLGTDYNSKMDIPLIDLDSTIEKEEMTAEEMTKEEIMTEEQSSEEMISEEDNILESNAELSSIQKESTLFS